MVHRDETVVDEFFGTRVADPYRALEDIHATATREFVLEQNARTRAYIDALPTRAALARRIAELMDYTRFSAPTVRAGRRFYLKHEGLRNQPALYVQEPDGQERVLIDPNDWTEDGTIALSNWSISRDGALCAYATSEAGSDWQVIRVRRVDNGVDLADELGRVKFTNIGWTPDHAGFYYSRFPEAGAVPAEDEMHFASVWYHRIGTPQSADVLIHEDPNDKELGFHAFVTEDAQFLVVITWRGTSVNNRVYVREVGDTGPLRPLFEREDARYMPIGHVDGWFYVHTDKGAPKGRVVRVRDGLETADEALEDVVPEADAVLEQAVTANGHLLVEHLVDACSALAVHRLDGTRVADVQLPAPGRIDQLSSQYEQPDVFLRFSSFAYAGEVFALDVGTGRLTTVFPSAAPIDPSDYVTAQTFCESEDGTRLPVFVCHRRGLALDGSHPLILSGYGGFAISVGPSYVGSTFAFLEQGGVYAVACLRGGGEYGEEWHRAGMLANKQNVFADFAAAAKHLVAQGYTTHDRLAIRGGSNGGLLVAATMLLYPDLFGAVVCQVPVIDMLRYHRFTVGSFWVGEYGNAEASEQEFKTLLAYSPLHNVRPGHRYPPILITTAESDDRVWPAHAYKFAATLQHAAPDDATVLLRVETRAGHGAGKPTAKVIEEQADVFAFVLHACRG